MCPLDLILDSDSAQSAEDSSEDILFSAGETVRAVLLFTAGLFFSQCSSVQNSDTAVLKEQAREVQEAYTDLSQCTEVKGHDDCKEYHDRYDRKIKEYISSSIRTAERKDSQIERTEKKLIAEQKYSELGKTVYWGAWISAGIAVFMLICMTAWKYKTVIARITGVPLPPWMGV